MTRRRRIFLCIPSLNPGKGGISSVDVDAFPFLEFSAVVNESSRDVSSLVRTVRRRGERRVFLKK
ncbi:hypothetical protein [Bartonella tribocorum]|uniref:hypothetical protein n=1 Tax=Bartonella tribocorum TaxID=85701 RepID=UPI00056FC7DB